MKIPISTSTFILALETIPAYAGPAGYGVCLSGCAAIVVACYAAAGFAFGNVPNSVAVPAVQVCGLSA